MEYFYIIKTGNKYFAPENSSNSIMEATRFNSYEDAKEKTINIENAEIFEIKVEINRLMNEESINKQLEKVKGWFYSFKEEFEDICQRLANYGILANNLLELERLYNAHGDIKKRKIAMILHMAIKSIKAEDLVENQVKTVGEVIDLLEEDVPSKTILDIDTMLINVGMGYLPL